MATLLGISERWYRGLEAREERTYKPAMAAGIVRNLDLTGDQAEVLWRHCGLEPPRTVAATPDPVLMDMVRRQTGALSYLSDEAWDVVTCNALAGLHCPLLTRPGARYQMRDWERAWAVPMLSEHRAAWQHTPATRFRNRRTSGPVAAARAGTGAGPSASTATATGDATRSNGPSTGSRTPARSRRVTTKGPTSSTARSPPQRSDSGPVSDPPDRT